MKEIKIEQSWKDLLSKEFNQIYFKNLTDFVRQEYATKTIYPPGNQIFAAFDSTPVDKVKVVILGQDPYHGIGQAHGLCFSVNPGITIPKSLINIFKEIESDLGIPFPQNGNLERWANQGILLLNATLTVEANKAGSHQNKGWEQFTDAAIEKLAHKKENLVFLLWGNFAQKKAELISKNKNHLILKAAHPSPLAAHRGFFGCKHFSKTNEFLVQNNLKPIEW